MSCPPPLLSSHGPADGMPRALRRKEGPSLTLYPLVPADLPVSRGLGYAGTQEHGDFSQMRLLPLRPALQPGTLFAIAPPYRSWDLLLLVPSETRREVWSKDGERAQWVPNLPASCSNLRLILAQDPGRGRKGKRRD